MEEDRDDAAVGMDCDSGEACLAADRELLDGAVHLVKNSEVTAGPRQGGVLVWDPGVFIGVPKETFGDVKGTLTADQVESGAAGPENVRCPSKSHIIFDKTK